MTKRLDAAVGVKVLAVICLAGLLAIPWLRSAIKTQKDSPHANELRQTLRKYKHSMDVNVCNTAECVHSASEILKKLNDKIDPCEDFKEFACGTYEKNTKIPDDKTEINMLSQMNIQFYEKLTTMLQEPIQPDDLKAYSLVKTYYQTCMNESAVESLGIQPMLELIQRIGGWPVLNGEKWNDESSTFEKLYLTNYEVGTDPDDIIMIIVSKDEKDFSKNIIEIKEGSTSSFREILLPGFDDPLVQSYYTYMVETAVALGADKSRAKIDLKESLMFKIDVAKITLPKEKKRNFTELYNKMSIGQLQAEFPKISWLDLINGFLAPALVVGLDEMVIVENPNYLKELQILLEHTPKRVLANSVIWDVVSSKIYLTTNKLRKIKLKFHSALTGKSVESSRSEICKELATSSESILNLAALSLYIKKIFNKKIKTSVSAMLNDIRDQFRKTLSEVDWMDIDTKNAALEKADKMTLIAAHSDEIQDDNKINEIFEKIHIIPNKLFESQLILDRINHEIHTSNLRKIPKENEWLHNDFSALQTNAFYSSDTNLIYISMGILLDSMFSPKRPAYLNYAALGSVIGHEITHGFDDQGSQFDQNGNLFDWWGLSSKQKYIEKTKCIIEQYSNYSILGTKLNGINTQGENVADIGGLKTAYTAYLSWTQRNGEEPTLPGLEKYSPRQLFWIMFGNLWCNVIRPESLKQYIMNDPHSPGQFRIIGSLTNNKMFAKDFNCPLGAPMNPKKKCQVW